jgi:hypothetical protein
MPTEPKFKLTIAQFHELRDEYGGICLNCGARKYGGIEPDARGYVCDDCGKKAVVGIEEALLRDRIEVVSPKTRSSVFAAYLDPLDVEDSDDGVDLD